jgi:tellurite resistance protein
MAGSRTHLEIAYKSIRVFADDGTLDTDELDALLAIALRDGAIDADERRVLERVLRAALESRLSPAARTAIARAAEQHGLAL